MGMFRYAEGLLCMPTIHLVCIIQFMIHMARWLKFVFNESCNKIVEFHNLFVLFKKEDINE